MSGPALVKVDADKAEALRKWAAENGYGPGAKAKPAERKVENPEIRAAEAPEPKPVVEVKLPDTWRVDCGECVSLLKGLPDSCVDAIVTDPPYEIGFMGKSWDSTGVAYDPKTWAECLRVLKPGGHLLAFAATRTYHRIAVAVEDAGFEIRDMVEWIYGTGFPKSLDVSKAIDKAAGAERESLGKNPNARESRSRIVNVQGGDADVTAPATPDAQKWAGWGTALKPAHEPIVLARKPLAGTVAGNVLRHGVGALNVDGCRVEYADGADMDQARVPQPLFDSSDPGVSLNFKAGKGRNGEVFDPSKGRWPANLILGPDAAAELDESAGERTSGGGVRRPRAWSTDVYAMSGGAAEYERGASTGGPSRFFYVAKPSRKERDAGLDGFEERDATEAQAYTGLPDLRMDRVQERKPRRNVHPTVKPVALMRYLCRLVTPPGGIVVDPFAGSGTTGIGATLEGFRFLGFELDADHAEIARARITYWAEGAE